MWKLALPRLFSEKSGRKAERSRAGVGSRQVFTSTPSTKLRNRWDRLEFYKVFDFALRPIFILPEKIFSFTLFEDPERNLGIVVNVNDITNFYDFRNKIESFFIT